MKASDAIAAVAKGARGLEPLGPDIDRAVATIDRAMPVLAPVEARALKGEPYFLELADAARKLEALLPEILEALRTYRAVKAVLSGVIP